MSEVREDEGVAWRSFQKDCAGRLGICPLATEALGPGQAGHTARQPASPCLLHVLVGLQLLDLQPGEVLGQLFGLRAPRMSPDPLSRTGGRG